MELHLHIENKIAKNLTPDGVIVCGNKDYKIAFTFDEEWAGHDVKTARFAYNGKYEDVVFTGDKCIAPAIHNASSVSVGVFAGDLRTTTPARIICKRSILCENGLPADPAPDVYNQIIELINKYVEVGAMTREEIIALIGDETDDLQGKIDDALATSDKTIVGAINEVLGLANGNKNNIDNAVETASNAKTVADDAKQAAQGAGELANTANKNATQALETAQSALDSLPALLEEAKDYTDDNGSYVLQTARTEIADAQTNANNYSEEKVNQAVTDINTKSIAPLQTQVDVHDRNIAVLQGDVQTALDTARGAQQGVGYESYYIMVETLNGADKTLLNRYQSVYIGTETVPDLWVYAIADAPKQYTYTSEEAFANDLIINKSVQVGYFIFKRLEQGKVPLENYYTKAETDAKVNEAISASQVKIVRLI